MSADNGIYILQASDGFRVAHAQAIENLWYWGWEDEEPKTGINPRYLKMYFGKSKVIETQEEAMKEALNMYKELSSNGLPIEYGISPISGWEDKPFPS